MGRWCDGSCREVGGREKLEEWCKEQGQLAEASEEDLGSKGGCCSNDDDDDDDDDDDEKRGANTWSACGQREIQYTK